LSVVLWYVYFFFFFFQAEDGIRDFHVTGVQTCALPICFHRNQAHAVAFGGSHQSIASFSGMAGLQTVHRLIAEQQQVTVRLTDRSEERRVGKECRYRWAPDG